MPSRQLGVLQFAIMLMAVATAAIHLYLAWVVIPRVSASGSPDIAFTLNGLGYLVLVAVLYIPIGGLRKHRSTIRWVLVGYTVLTIALWFFMAFLPGDRTLIGYMTKGIEIALTALLILEGRKALP